MLERVLNQEEVASFRDAKKNTYDCEWCPRHIMFYFLLPKAYLVGLFLKRLNHFGFNPGSCLNQKNDTE